MVQAILDWFAHRWNAFIDFMWRLILSIYDMLKDFFYWIIEELFLIGNTILDSIAYLFDGLSITQYFSMIPPETTHMLNVIGFSEAMGMIVTSLGIRLILQLIPFVRWGS